MRRACLGVLMALLPTAAQAQRAPRATTVAWQEAWHEAGPVHLAVADEQTVWAADLPALPAVEGQVLCLRFRARMPAGLGGGWNNYLAVKLNGTALDNRLADGRPRVVNRKPGVDTSHPGYPRIDLMEVRDGLPCLQIFFGPEDQLDARILTDREEGYWYLLDLADAVKGDGANRLELVNTALARYWGNDTTKRELLVEDLALGRVPAEVVAELRAGQTTHREPLPGVELETPSATVTVPPGGGLQLRVGDETWSIESSFSFPHDGGMGFNRLRCLPAAEGEDGWRPIVERRGEELHVAAEGLSYRLERTLVAQGRRVAVRDAITNRTHEVLGVAAEQTIVSPGFPRQVLLNGLESAGHGSATVPENPTVYLLGPTSGLGTVAEDDASRLQQHTMAETNTASFGTRQLGLQPGETYTLEWAVYPDQPDYFAFLNAVRRDWQVNFTVDGPFDFVDVRPLATEEGRQHARELVKRRRLKLFALVPWFEYYNGWPYDRDAYRRMMADGMAFYRELVPDAKFLACVETNLVPVPLSLFGDTIPADWPIGRDKGGKYGQIATPAMTAKVDATPWRDSCLRDAGGNLKLDCWYVQHYADKPALNLMTYPTLDNHRFHHAVEQFTWLLDEVGFDGLYIDQFSMSGFSHRYTDEQWDARTITLDADGRVASRRTDVNLATIVARKEWLEMVLRRGKTVVCNGNSAVPELQAVPAFRFMETQGYDPMAGDGPPLQPALARGQLGAPLALGHSYGSMPHKSAEAWVRTVIAHLRFGLLYYYYSTEFPAEGDEGGEYGPVNHMFPFTPIELHEGWMLGQERLITCRSGEYPWPFERDPQVHQFDRRGRERAADVAVSGRGQERRLTIRMEDWHEIAVVE